MSGEAPGTGGVCVFTIASRNYTHAARALMEGVARHAPAAHRVLALCDERGDFDYSADIFEVIELSEIELPQREQFIFQYTLLELNTAIKPFVIAALFARGFEKVIYFDPDIAIHSPLDDMIARLDAADVLLTPHITGPLDDGGYPHERQLMMCGTFNLGFVAFRRCSQSEAFVRWWQQKLERDCVVDLARGLFTDQKWVDYAPSFCDRVAVVRHPGWNLAYWNLPMRTVAKRDGSFTVNGEPLVFFHFSGMDPANGIFSKHQDRFTRDNLPAAVAELARAYEALIRGHGYPALLATPFAHANFSDGTPIPDLVRKIFREQRDELAARFPDPADADAPAFIAYVNEPAVVHGRSTPRVTRLFHELYHAHPGLQLESQFPDVFGIHAEHFARWCVGDGCPFHKLPEVFLHPVREALRDPPAPGVAAGSGGFNRWVFQTAWRFKDLTHTFIPLQTRQKIAAALFNRAYAPQQSAPARPATPVIARTDRPALVPGLNVIGYLRAELGVGKAARATLRACKAADVPAAAIDFSRGVTSRMEEDIPAGFESMALFDTTLLHVNADQTPFAIADNEAAMQGRYNIGFWNWELSEFPDTWPDAANFLDEVWAPSTFCATAISRRLRIPVTHIPYAIDVIVPPGIGRRELGLPESGFTFLYMFDALSVPERKNPMAVVEAYLRAKPFFTRPTRLVLKMINGDKEPELNARLRDIAAREPTIILMNRYLRRPELNALFNAADCYVSLHRSEGFGLTLAESMFLGKPVIATGWSANMDFMTSWNSLPVAYRLVQIERDHGPYAKGQWWADPDMDDAARHMTRLVNEPGLAESIGANAARDLREHHSPAAVGRLIAARLRAIAAGRSP